MKKLKVRQTLLIKLLLYIATFRIMEPIEKVKS